MTGRRWKIGLVVFALVIAGAMVVQASSADPGSEQDPLITQSYFERYNKLQVVEMKPGQKMILEEGSEFIVRSGKAVVISTQDGGLPDLTDGKDLANGQLIPHNHLILVPRNDGRGFKIMAENVPSTGWIVVRGPYTVSSAN